MAAITPDVSKRYTFADYLTWVDDKRIELIDGFIKLMSPAPLRFHQEILSKLFFQFALYLKGKDCSAYFAPIDVRLPETSGVDSDEAITTVVQPDLIIVCDPKKLDEKGCLGAPDFIAEVTSQSSLKRDIEEKYQVYQKHGVREYWVVFPEIKSVNVFVLNDEGIYEIKGMFASDSKVKVNIFDDLEIDLNEIFTS